jgi:homoserine dehydrogenase
VFIEGAHAGEMMLYGRGAGGVPTASAVVGDLLEVATWFASGVARRPTKRDPVTIRPIDELMAQYYVTIDVADRPGVLAAVAAAFGAHSVSIRSMEQVGLGDEARLVFITHVAREADLQATLAELARLDAVERIGGLLRVIGVEH